MLTPEISPHKILLAAWHINPTAKIVNHSYILMNQGEGQFLSMVNSDFFFQCFQTETHYIIIECRAYSVSGKKHFGKVCQLTNEFCQ